MQGICVVLARVYMPEMSKAIAERMCMQGFQAAIADPGSVYHALLHNITQKDREDSSHVPDREVSLHAGEVEEQEFSYARWLDAQIGDMPTALQIPTADSA